MELMIIKNQVIDEPEKVVVPEFVAEWIEELKKSYSNLAWVWEVYPSETKIKKWLESNTDKFMRAWLDGYEVENESLYINELREYLIENDFPQSFIDLLEDLYINGLLTIIER